MSQENQASALRDDSGVTASRKRMSALRGALREMASSRLLTHARLCLPRGDRRAGR